MGAACLRALLRIRGVATIDIRSFARLYNRWIEMEQQTDDLTEVRRRTKRDLVTSRRLYREAFEVLTKNDPELRDAVGGLILEPWPSSDVSGPMGTYVIEDLDIDSFARRIVAEVEAVRTERKLKSDRQQQLRDHALMRSAFLRTFDALTRGDAALRSHLLEIVPLEWPLDDREERDSREVPEE